MHPVRTIPPELNALRPQQISSPICRPRNLLRKPPLQLLHLSLKHLPPSQHPALLRSHRSKLTQSRSALKIFICLFNRQLRHDSRNSHLPKQRLPVKTHRRPRILRQFNALLTLCIRIETEPQLIHSFHQHHSHARHTVSRSRGQRHRAGIAWLTRLGSLHPRSKQRDRINYRLHVDSVHREPSRAQVYRAKPQFIHAPAGPAKQLRLDDEFDSAVFS